MINNVSNANNPICFQFNDINLINSGILQTNNVQQANNMYDSIRLIQLQDQLINIYNQSLGPNNTIYQSDEQQVPFKVSSSVSVVTPREGENGIRVGVEARGEVSARVEGKVNGNNVKVEGGLRWQGTAEVEREISRNGIKVGGRAAQELSAGVEGKVNENSVEVRGGIRREISAGVEGKVDSNGVGVAGEMKEEVSAGVEGKVESGNGTGIKGEAEVYIEAGIWAEADISVGKAQRVKKNGNEYIVCKEGFSVNVGYGVNVGVRGAVTVYNGQDSITGGIDLSVGEGFLVGAEAQRGAALNTNSWALEFGGSIGLDIGSLLGKTIPAVKLFLKGEVQLQEVANESKKEIKEEADKILQNELSQELKEVKKQSVNQLRGDRIHRGQGQSEIQQKNQQIKQKRNELYKKALFKAWNVKQHQVKQRLNKESQKRMTTIITKFAEGIVNKLPSVLPVPDIMKPLIKGLIEGFAGFVINAVNSILLAAFSSPIEKIINEVNVTDFFKDIK